jgi:Protein of unknown function (DUF1236)
MKISRQALSHKFVIGAVEQYWSDEVSIACRVGDTPQLGKTPFNRRNTMRNIGAILVVAGLFSFPLTAQAQGIPGGATGGAQQGGDAAGPLGAAVGGVVGGVTGGVAGLLGVDQRPRFREYVVREHIPSSRLGEPVTVGTVLPPKSITFYSIPREFGVPPEYRYAMINDQVVLVEPTSRRIVEVID